MNIAKQNEVLTDVIKMMNGLDGMSSMAVLCMIIDYVANKNNMQSVELLDIISPLIKEVNENLGQWDYKEIV